MVFGILCETPPEPQKFKNRICNLGSIKKAAWLTGTGINNSLKDSLLRTGNPFGAKHFLLHPQFGSIYQRLDPKTQAPLGIVVDRPQVSEFDS